MSADCGGDCWGCIGHIEADMGGDPEVDLSKRLVAEEIAQGLRESDGTPKPQSYFLAGNPSFIKVLWLHDDPEEPVELWSELDADRYEVRKVDIWADGRVGYAEGDVEAGGTVLGEKPVPPLTEINTDPQFIAQEVSRDTFERRWREVVEI